MDRYAPETMRVNGGLWEKENAMRTRVLLCAGLTAHALCLGAIANAQVFTCDPHPPSGCDHLVELNTRYDVHLGTVVDYDGAIELLEATPWQKATACNCIYVPTGSTLWKGPELCPTPQYSLSHTFSFSYSIEVSATTSIHVDLANALLGGVGIDASLTATEGFTFSDVYTENWTLPVPRLNCWDHHGRVSWLMKTLEGYAEAAKVEQEWGCTIGQTSTIIVTHCGKHRVDGQATNAVQVGFDYTHPPPSCHGPDPIDPDHQNKTDEPCASCHVTGIVGCPDFVPGCCGLHGGS
ncbi:hypothetical protein AY599_00185 [Leptolyngbya valderiana BDU 20041]|nr:hypothetical protein AY599_00185 [Leptolyngbya valderiana BDU 20041]